MILARKYFTLAFHCIINMNLW